MEYPNNMMPQHGMPATNTNGMQRPQHGNFQQQLHAKILTDLRNSMQAVPVDGWQATFDVRARANRVLQLVSGLRMLGFDTMERCIAIAESFELSQIRESPSQEIYIAKMEAKQSDVRLKREVRVSQAGLAGMQSQMQNGNMQNGNNMGPNMMSNGGMGMSNGQMNPQVGQMDPTGTNSLAFPTQLQRQMHPSSVPPSQQSNQLDLANVQMPGQMQNPNSIPQQQGMNPNQNALAAQALRGRTADQEALALATSTYESMNEGAKANMRSKLLQELPPQEQQRLASGNGDVLFKILYERARLSGFRTRQMLAEEAKRKGGVSMGANPMMGNNMLQQQLAAQSSAQPIDLSSILGQQATALALQESGEQVVPASNNNFGQTNLPQSINPHMLENHSEQQNGNAQSMIDRRMHLMQQQQQQQQNLQRQNAVAAQQAMAQRQHLSQLRGQPGGLNAPNALNGGAGGMTNSPVPGVSEMNMLNRPLQPPLSTPQQPNRPHGSTTANELLQHHQQMMNQSGQALNGLPVPQQQHASMLRAMHTYVPKHLHPIFLAMGPQQQSAALKNLMDQRRRQQQQQQTDLGLSQQPDHPVSQNNMQMPQMQGNDQQAMFNSMQQQMGSAVPGFNSQPPPNQQAQQPMNAEAVEMHQRFLMQQRQRQQVEQLNRSALDSRSFPRQVLDQLGIAIPNEVGTWAKLKHHIAQNQAVLPPQTLEKLNNAQNQWFTEHPAERDQARAAVQKHLAEMRARTQHLQQPQAQSNSQQLGGPSGGQAPPAQMVPPTPQMQPPQTTQGGNSLGQARPEPAPQQQFRPTPDQIRIFREKIPNAAQMTDNQIVATISSRRAVQSAQRTQEQQQQMAQQHALRHAQQARAQQQSGMGMQQSTPPTQVNNQAGQNQKRLPQSATSDDVVEIPNPNPARVKAAQQAPPMQANRSQQSSRAEANGPLIREQLANMDPNTRAQFMANMKKQQLQQQQQQMENLRRAQINITNPQFKDGNNASNPNVGQQNQQSQPQQQVQQDAKRIELMAIQRKIEVMYAEAERTTPKGPAIQLTDQAMMATRQLLVRMWPPFQAMPRMLLQFMQAWPESDEFVKKLLRARVLYLQNAADLHGNFKDYLSIGPPTLQGMEKMVTTFVQNVKGPQQNASNGRPPPQASTGGNQAQAQAAQALVKEQAQRPTSTKPQGAPQAPPLARAKSQQGHVRKASSSTRAPPAPTDNKSFWSETSPHGVPKYEAGSNDLTPDKLKFPPQKKRKPNQPDSIASTPAGQVNTPGTVNASPNMPNGKTNSPEQVRKTQQQTARQQAEIKAADAKKFRCTDTFCEASFSGFQTEKELTEHTASEHAPVENPLQYLLENAAAALGVDIDCNPLPSKSKVEVKTQPRPTPVPSLTVEPQRPGRIPNLKQDIAAPTAAALAKLKGKVAAAPAETKPVGPTPQREKTLREHIEEKMGFEPSPPSPEVKLAASPMTSAEDISWNNFMQDAFSSLNEDSDGWNNFDERTDFDGITEISMHARTESSPSQSTPSDAATSQDSRESDVSASERMRINLSWDAFGRGDTQLTEVLVPKSLGTADTEEGAESTGKNGDDTTMVDAGDEATKATNATAIVDDLDWAEPNDWSTLFGDGLMDETTF